MANVNLDNLLNGSQGKFWNYSNNQKEGYSPTLSGTLVKVSIAQAHEFGHPETKSYWPDGNPVILLRMHVKDMQGDEYLFDIKPKSTMWFEDIQPACPEGSLSNILGKQIQLDFLGLVQVPGKAVNRNKFQLAVIGDGQWPNEGFDDKMPPTRFEAMGQQPAQATPSPQQYTAQKMMQPQQQAQQVYNQQQQMPANLQAAMRSAQQAGAASQAAMIQQQFPGATVTQGYPGPMSTMPTAQNPMPQVDPNTDLYNSDIPF